MQDNKASKTVKESKEVVENVTDWAAFMGTDERVKDFGEMFMSDSDGWTIMDTAAFYGD